MRFFDCILENDFNVSRSLGVTLIKPLYIQLLDQ